MTELDLDRGPAFAWCIDEFDGNLLAGFLEGEIHLGIAEMNGGQSHACLAQVSQRDDDADILEWAVAITGLGSLRRVPAQRTSKPQVSWRIAAMGDCLELAEFLTRFPFRGRKRLELALWRRAVRTWAAGASGRNDRMRGLKRDLQALHRYSPRPYATALRPRNHVALRGYISGFVMAEGHLGLARSSARLTVNQRADDRPLLEMLKAETGFGSVYRYDRPDGHPVARWMVFARSELAIVSSWLVDAGLPGRKGRIARIWADGVGALGRDPAACQLAVSDLAEARRYRARAGPLLELPKRDLRAACLHALVAWAGQEVAPLSCDRYADWRARHDDRSTLPTRNTVARQFGGWHEALAAAGLASRAASAPETVAARAAGGARRRERHRAFQRARVFAAVAAFAEAHGRPPRAMEFFRWRMEHGVDAPTQGPVYRLFPGGWAEVLASAA